jgi:hypothetical protein
MFHTWWRWWKTIYFTSLRNQIGGTIIYSVDAPILVGNTLPWVRFELFIYVIRKSIWIVAEPVNPSLIQY